MEKKDGSSSKKKSKTHPPSKPENKEKEIPLEKVFIYLFFPY